MTSWPTDDADDVDPVRVSNGLEDLDRTRLHERPLTWVVLGLVALACGGGLWGTIPGAILSTLGAVITLAGTIALGVVLAARYLDGTGR